MIKEVKLPEVSDNVETGDVLKVLVNVGDKVEVDQPLVELETEKATFEVPSTESGIVKEIKVKQGDIIKIGAVIITVETNGEDEEKKEEKAEEKKEEKTDEKEDDKADEKKDDKADEKKDDKADEKKDDKADEKKDDKAGEKKDDKADEKKDDKADEKKDDKADEKKDDKADEKKDDKADEKKDNKADEKKDDDDEKKDDDDEKKDDDDEKKEEKGEVKKDPNVNKTAAAASPSVRRLARELGVDINSVTNSGGRITEEDLKKFVKDRLASDSSSEVSIAQKSLPDFKKWGEIEIESMSKIRAITADAMTYAWTTVPMVTQFDKADITKLEEFRKKNLKKVEDAGGHLTITSVLVKVCEAALRNFPQFNSSVDLQNKEIIFKKYFNIGVAVDTDRGLLVPVLKNIDKKNITEISKELTELAEKARNKKITPDEMDGGNFTISNLGGIGGTNFTPIVYAPQVAILGVSRGSNEAVYNNNNEKFEPALMLPLSLTYDHRIINGADAARFLRWLCEALENPMMIFL